MLVNFVPCVVAFAALADVLALVCFGVRAEVGVIALVGPRELAVTHVSFGLATPSCTARGNDAHDPELTLLADPPTQ